MTCTVLNLPPPVALGSALRGLRGSSGSLASWLARARAQPVSFLEPPSGTALCFVRCCSSGAALGCGGGLRLFRGFPYLWGLVSGLWPYARSGCGRAHRHRAAGRSLVRPCRVSDFGVCFLRPTSRLRGNEAGAATGVQGRACRCPAYVDCRLVGRDPECHARCLDGQMRDRACLVRPMASREHGMGDC